MIGLMDTNPLSRTLHEERSGAIYELSEFKSSPRQCSLQAHVAFKIDFNYCTYHAMHALDWPTNDILGCSQSYLVLRHLLLVI